MWPPFGCRVTLVYLNTWGTSSHPSAWSTHYVTTNVFCWNLHHEKKPLTFSQGLTLRCEISTAHCGEGYFAQTGWSVGSRVYIRMFCFVQSVRRDKLLVFLRRIGLQIVKVLIELSWSVGKVFKRMDVEPQEKSLVQTGNTCNKQYWGGIYRCWKNEGPERCKAVLACCGSTTNRWVGKDVSWMEISWCRLSQKTTFLEKNRVLIRKVVGD